MLHKQRLQGGCYSIASYHTVVNQVSRARCLGCYSIRLSHREIDHLSLRYLTYLPTSQIRDDARLSGEDSGSTIPPDLGCESLPLGLRSAGLAFDLLVVQLWCKWINRWLASTQAYSIQASEARLLHVLRFPVKQERVTLDHFIDARVVLT